MVHVVAGIAKALPWIVVASGAHQHSSSAGSMGGENPGLALLIIIGAIVAFGGYLRFLDWQDKRRSKS